jgi:hypothetical protein
MSRAGEFEIYVEAGGYPVWCTIRYQGKQVARISHGELSDLKYAVEKAMQRARNALPEPYKDEV